jgi:hypothetical protein
MASAKIVVIDYHKGNLLSVQHGPGGRRRGGGRL